MAVQEAATKKCWTEEERLELAAKLDTELDEYIAGLEKKSYTEGWPEDRWQEEMEKHPFFMKKAPEPGDELSPLVEGLQQLKYGKDDNTPEELASNYKDDGNFNYKHKKYRLAILSYTEGIKTQCKDLNLMANLYNNRAAAHYMLKNYRSSFNDSKHAAELKKDYIKALNRAASCAFILKDYNSCIDFCDCLLEYNPKDKAILALKSQATSSREILQRDKRKQEKKEKCLHEEEEKLLRVIIDRGISVESNEEDNILDLKNLESRIPQIAQSKVHLDNNNRLIWPVIFLYPEMQETDLVQNFHEDVTLKEQLQELFCEQPQWDSQRRYTLDNITLYFEGKDKNLHKVDVDQTLGEVLKHERFIVRGGTPAFLVFVSHSQAETRYLSGY